MLVYQNSLAGFKKDVSLRSIEDVIADAVIRHLGHRVGESEQRSWQNSLGRIGNIIQFDNQLPEDAHVAIECQLPMSNKRIVQSHILLSSAGFVLCQRDLGTTPNIAPPSNLKFPELRG